MGRKRRGGIWSQGMTGDRSHLASVLVWPCSHPGVEAGSSAPQPHPPHPHPPHPPSSAPPSSPSEFPWTNAGAQGGKADGSQGGGKAPCVLSPVGLGLLCCVCCVVIVYVVLLVSCCAGLCLGRGERGSIGGQCCYDIMSQTPGTPVGNSKSW